MNNSRSEEINNGVRMYQRGMKQIEKSKQSMEKIKQEIEYKEVSQCNFHPQINQISALIVDNQRVEPVGDHLNKLAKIQKEKRERARSMKLSSEFQNYSFHPQINQISRQISNEKYKQIIAQSELSPDRFTLLFEDWKVKMERN